MTSGIQHSRNIYNLSQWSEGYFDIDATTEALVVHPYNTPEKGLIHWQSIEQYITDNALQYPVLIRFLDILQDRVHKLSAAFSQAINALNYNNDYRAIYPVKVNQQRDVVEALLSAGAGLEVGSKAELMAALSYAEHTLHSAPLTIICNGYKDRAYIRLALMARALGIQIFIVIEKLAEYSVIREEAPSLLYGSGHTMRLGVRVRLSSIASGQWQNSGGEKSKFGLSSQDLLSLINAMKASGDLPCLTLLHTHMGSQIANIEDIRRGIGELSRYYCELHHNGVPLTTMDIGGGLGVDYEGTGTRHEFSMNYSLDEFAHTVVAGILEVVQTANLPCPYIISEPGRALSAHHAVLVTNIVNTETPVMPLKNQAVPVSGVMAAMLDAYEQRETHGLSETYHRLKHGHEAAHAAFISGTLTLSEQAYADNIYRHGCRYLAIKLNPDKPADREILADIQAPLLDKVFCNFSLFQSLPDVWALKQIFPIMPLQNLHESPERAAVLVDITCDSDGRIDHYAGQRQALTPSLPLSNQNSQSGALLGIFLVGAYQETLGDMHNLFGRPDALNITLDKQGSHYSIAKGERVSDVLTITGYGTDALKKRYPALFENMDCSLPQAKKEAYLKTFLATLNESTYLS